MVIFKIRGVIKEEETGVPLSGLFIKAYDKDLIFDDLLGTDISGPQGEIEIVNEWSDFRDFFELRPDIYFKVFRSDKRTLIHTTADAVRWNAGRISDFEIRVPGEKLHEAEGTKLSATGDDGKPRDEFEVGESLGVRAQGLRPRYPYDIGVHRDGKLLFASRLITNLRGEIESTVLWPQMGLDDPNSNKTFTFEEARERWAGKNLTLTLSSGKKRILQQVIRFAGTFSRPMIMATDRRGRMVNGFEVGSQPLYLTIRNVRAEGPVRVFMVPRQHDWRQGDHFEPAVLTNGRPAILDVEKLPADGVIRFAEARALLPGAYDFIARPLRYGYEESDVLRILATDVIGGRQTTGLVIREPFWTAKPVLGGCVNRIPVSGRSVVGSPYFRYADTFEIGETVYAAMDPGIVDPGNISKMCALYVIPSKDDAQWADNSLEHLAILGGNAGTQKIKVQSGCVNYNKLPIWPNASEPGHYDIVADFGNNTPDAAAFTPDHAYDTPLDIIDGYFVSGFRIVEDPGTMQEFAEVGNWNYDEGTVTVQDETGGYHDPADMNTMNTLVPMRAHVFFPADGPNITDPAEIHQTAGGYPLFVVVHGNGHDYASYDDLLRHVARNGFIAASIHLNGGMRALGRANVFFAHLPVLQAAFGAQLQNNIGIMGHSRGGEAVVKAARLNQQQGLGHGINAVISLAPTDQYGSEVFAGAWAKPYLVIYGSRDGDINGDIWTPGYDVPQTGFALYDRADGMTKSMVFVYRATHNGFVTSNYDADPGEPDLLAPADQQKVTFAYMNAFLRRHLKNEPHWEGIFTGEWKPASVGQTGVSLYVQYQDPSHKAVDDFEGAVSNWQTSSIVGNVTHDGTLPADPGEGKMHDYAGSPGLDPKSPHDTKGMMLRWNNLGDKLVFSIPNAHKDVSGYTVLSFRVSQRVDSPHNPAGQAQNLRVALKDAANNERAVRVGAFTEIPFPDYRLNHDLSKSAMNTIRIPLTSYTIVCAGQPKVDLQNITSLSFMFTEKATGEIDIDDIEFTN